MFSINNIGTWQPKIGVILANTKKPKVHKRKRQKQICSENIKRLKQELKTVQGNAVARDRILAKIRNYELHSKKSASQSKGNT